MKAAEIIQRRSEDWNKLEVMSLKATRRENRNNPEFVNQFASLYRDACADLALATANQLPPGTVEYLHSLVAKAHNQLYRSRTFDINWVLSVVFHQTPRRIFSDPCVHIAALIFWGLFSLAAWMAYEKKTWPDFAQNVVGEEQLEQATKMFDQFGGRSFEENMFMAGFYIFNNAGIGLRVFVSMFLILPGLVELCHNAIHIGAIFGHLFSPDSDEAGNNFKSFVTAHGPFELTAIILSAGAGLRIGISWLATNNMRRLDSLQINALKSLPVALCATVFFFIAAFIEGFVSPFPDSVVPWSFKAFIAVASSGFIMFYFVVLGYPWRQE